MAKATSTSLPLSRNKARYLILAMNSKPSLSMHCRHNHIQQAHTKRRLARIDPPIKDPKGMQREALSSSNNSTYLAGELGANARHAGLTGHIAYHGIEMGLIFWCKHTGRYKGNRGPDMRNKALGPLSSYSLTFSGAPPRTNALPLPLS